MSVSEAGISDGEVVSLIQTPLRCCTTSFDGTFASMAPLERCGGPVLVAALSADCRRLLTVSFRGEAKTWCAETGRQLSVRSGQVLSGEFTGRNQLVVGIAEDDSAHV